MASIGRTSSTTSPGVSPITSTSNRTPRASSASVSSPCRTRRSSSARTTPTGADRLFRGRVTDVAILHGKLNDWLQLYAVQAVDNTAALDRQLYTKRWSATSATTIVQDIIDNFTTGFTRTNVQAALPTVTTEFKMQYPSEALTQIARLIGAYWYLDEDLDLHFFLTEVSSTPDDLDANNLDFSKFQYGENGDQIRNRILVEGLGTFVTVPRVAGDTTIPVESATAFASSMYEQGHRREPDRDLYGEAGRWHREHGERGATYPVGTRGAGGDAEKPEGIRQARGRRELPLQNHLCQR